MKIQQDAIKYNNLCNVLITSRVQFNLILLEVSTLSFAGNTIKTYSKFLLKIIIIIIIIIVIIIIIMFCFLFENFYTIHTKFNEGISTLKFIIYLKLNTYIYIYTIHIYVYIYIYIYIYIHMYIIKIIMKK